MTYSDEELVRGATNCARQIDAFEVELRRMLPLQGLAGADAQIAFDADNARELADTLHAARAFLVVLGERLEQRPAGRP